MPLFSNPQNPSAQVWEPQAAEGRLAKTAGATQAGVFTSDLSVSEYVLLGEAGFENSGMLPPGVAGAWSVVQHRQVPVSGQPPQRVLCTTRTS